MSLEVEARRQALRARAHPIRLRMLSLLTGTPMSAAELGRELGISQALASYHLRFLVNAEAVELAEELSNRGGKERRYRYHAEDPIEAPNPAAGGVAEEYELLLTAAIDELRRRSRSREADGTGLMVDAEVWVTDEQWAAFRASVADASVRLHEQAAKPRAQGTRPVSVSTFLFPLATPSAAE